MAKYKITIRMKKRTKNKNDPTLQIVAMNFATSMRNIATVANKFANTKSKLRVNLCVWMGL